MTIDSIISKYKITLSIETLEIIEKIDALYDWIVNKFDKLTNINNSVKITI